MQVNKTENVKFSWKQDWLILLAFFGIVIYSAKKLYFPINKTKWKSFVLWKNNTDNISWSGYRKLY